MRKRSANAVPDARVCFDPFHVVQLGSKATDQVRRAEYNKHGRSGSDTGKWIKGVRYSLLKDPAKQTTQQLLRLCEVQQTNKPMFRAALLYGELRYLYRSPRTRQPSAWTHGWRGRPDRGSNRSSSSRARSANTKPACSPRSSSGSATDAWRR